MRVMIASDGPHAHFYIRAGWAKVFQALGHEAILWDINSKPSFDAFDEINPDLFIGQTYNLDRGVFKCIKERPHLKVVMRASDWGSFQEEIDLEKYPILVANDNEKKMVEQLKRETGKPDFVYNHYHDNWMKLTHNEWGNIGVKVVSMMHAADLFDYVDGEEREELKSNISFIGGYWPYKAKTLDKYILKLCHPVGKYNIKIFGGSGWPVVQHLGRISNENVKHAFKSATICPNISELHSQDFGYDVIERPFKILASGGFCISDYVESMAKDVFNNGEVIFAHSVDEFEELIGHYLRHPEERIPHIQKGYQSIIQKHTYFHRVAKILDHIGMKTESKKCIDLISALTES